ncbi:CPBP family intramembrane glutamic endopeptidase [Breznakiella homolactica]|uniref:CPBP family intramembrane metalloprotease n=1 Tax=Breznakiella homolactica TaxID=2798577 RepID=A0A7T7XKA8_9SPIR|nr:type II CAAX endopeptidase family protein [Breznakiella homolactica]QQO07980.1 CPBP family intramembrane metalloprotease [Breznakiella homolactica]
MKKIITFLAITFGLTWLCWGLLSLKVTDLNGAGIAQVVVAFSMWFPGIGFFITRALFKNEKQPLSLLFYPRFKGHIRYYIAAWISPLILTLLGSALYFLIFRGTFTMDSEFFRTVMDNPASGTEITEAMIPLIIISQVASGVFFGPLFNMLFALGEELGWRGFLFPELRKRMGAKKAVLLSGVIWGLWHAPITAMGHNYSFGYWGYPWTGILAMCVFCTFFGSFLAYITEKTGSIWPAALCHGAVNAIAGLPLLFLEDMNANRLLGPAISGFIGGIPLAVLGIWCMFRLQRGNAPEPEVR